MSVVISAPYVTLFHQLVDVFTKSLVGISYDILYTKLGVFNLYVPLRERVSNSDIKLLVHLGSLIFTSHIRTCALSFSCAILGLIALMNSTL